MPRSVEFQPLGRSIGRAHKFVRAWGDRELADLNSSVTEWIVLFHIANAPEPGASQTEIARFSDMGGPALVRHIDRLEAEGIVIRTRDASDRRTIRLTLTPAGHDRLESIRLVMANCDQQLRAVLTKNEAEVMQRALDKVFGFCLGELQGCSASGGTELTGPPPGVLASPLAPPERSKR
jgi:MarR family transcriptional regulator, transcriptional regulator for hemolysin